MNTILIESKVYRAIRTLTIGWRTLLFQYHREGKRGERSHVTRRFCHLIPTSIKGGSVGGKEALWAYDPRKGVLGNPPMEDGWLEASLSQVNQ